VEAGGAVGARCGRAATVGVLGLELGWR